jgi:flagellar biosynthesis/type III secretory pathway protein FliH
MTQRTTHTTVLTFKRRLHGVRLGGVAASTNTSASGKIHTSHSPSAKNANGTRASHGSNPNNHVANQSNSEPKHENAPINVEAELVAQQAQVAELLSVMIEQVQELEQRRAQSIQELREVAVRLSVAIARAVIHEELEQNDARIHHLVDFALSQLGTEQPILVKLNPLDLAQFSVSLNEKLQAKQNEGAINPITFRAEPTLSRGDCLIESDRYDLSSSVSHQLAQIENQLREVLHDAEIERRKNGDHHQGLQRFPDRRNFA